jgi:hypothetical protein
MHGMAMKNKLAQDELNMINWVLIIFKLKIWILFNVVKQLKYIGVDFVQTKYCIAV